MYLWINCSDMLGLALRLIHSRCVWHMQLWQKWAVQKIENRKFSISAETQPSAAASCVKRSMCESAFNKHIFHNFFLSHIIWNFFKIIIAVLFIMLWTKYSFINNLCIIKRTCATTYTQSLWRALNPSLWSLVFAHQSDKCSGLSYNKEEGRILPPQVRTRSTPSTLLSI